MDGSTRGRVTFWSVGPRPKTEPRLGAILTKCGDFYPMDRLVLVPQLSASTGRSYCVLGSPRAQCNGRLNNVGELFSGYG